jgi:hypothetical protein
MGGQPGKGLGIKIFEPAVAARTEPEFKLRGFSCPGGEEEAKRFRSRERQVPKQARYLTRYR